jgi:hypothetical protein
MSTRTTSLALEVVSEVSDAATDLGKVESAAAQAVTQVDRLSASAGDVSSKLDGVSSSADGLDSASGAATGALGALASGFELVGAEGAAKALQDAALATDFLSGVGQSATLAVQAQGAATKALTVAQRAANAVMRANPIGLVVTAVLLLVAGLVLAYNKSETFRNIVQSAGRVGKAAMESVVDAVSSIVSWVRDKIPDAFKVILKVINLYLTPWKLALGLVKDAAELVGDWVGKIPAKLGDLKDKAGEIAAPLLAPFEAVQAALEWIADKLDNLKPPDWLLDLPGVPGGRTASSDPSPVLMSDWSLAPRAADVAGDATITVKGLQDPHAWAVQAAELLARHGLAVKGG